MIRSSLAAVLAGAALSFAGIAQAAPVTVEQSLFLTNPSGGLVYNIQTDGSLVAPTTSYYQLIVDPSWNQTTRFVTLTTEPIGTVASYQLFADADALLTSSNTGTFLAAWSQADIPLNNQFPFFTYLLTPGQYVLSIMTQTGQLNIGTQLQLSMSTPVPGPIAGAGLPALLALGGFVWARRRKAAAA
jgi:hypothetical protein